LNVIEGNKEKLPFILWHDVVMTCSVLIHMPNLDNIINNLEEIALKAVVLAETNDRVD
jgi:2-polyprenyl-3-methyl-5-hydroxy-6-metoxy-1,4-benzoquinol methylase